MLIASATITDVVTAVSYGGATLTRTSLITGGVGSEPGAAYMYYKGTAVASSGTVNVVCTGGTATAWAVTVTANQAWTQTAGTATITSTSLANPSGTITPSQGFSGLAVGILFSGQNDPSTITTNSGYTALLGSAAGGRDFGSQSGAALQGLAAGNNPVSVGWVQTADDVAAVVGLIQEVAPTVVPPDVNAALQKK